MAEREYIGEEDVQVKYKRSDEKILCKRILPGQQFKMARSEINEEIFTVVRSFSHHVSCVSQIGFQESFSYFELIKNATWI